MFALSRMPICSAPSIVKAQRSRSVKQYNIPIKSITNNYVDDLYANKVTIVFKRERKF